MRHPRAQGIATVTALMIALVGGVGLTTGCGNGGADKGTAVETSLTEATARAHITDYLLDTLRAMPPGTGFSITPQNPAMSKLGNDAALSVPCDDDPHGPEQAQISYWVVGIPDGQQARYFQLIRDYWTGRGFRLNPSSESDWAAVRTPDGYSLTVQRAVNDGSVSVDSGSPCYPVTAKGTTTPQPTELHRPS